MKKKDKTTFNFILSEIGIEISPVLESLIAKPQKIELLNNMALEQVVKEFAPIHKKYKYTLDGPSELRPITIFEVYLMCRLTNKPHLQKILDE